jgi:DNA polymerase III epsilon subunit-like protein
MDTSSNRYFSCVEKQASSYNRAAACTASPYRRPVTRSCKDKSVCVIEINPTPPTPYLVLVFDTETTGLIHKTDSSLHPYIIQLSYMIYDKNSEKVIETYNNYIKLRQIDKLTEQSTAITGITKDILETQGIDIVDALVAFYHAYRKCNEIVAHNLKFDSDMILIEIERNYNSMVSLGCQSPESLFNTVYNNVYGIKYYDTMQEGTIVCNILKESTKIGPKRMYRKFPTLSELSQTLFGSIPEGLHNAIVDVELCLKCYLALVAYRSSTFPATVRLTTDHCEAIAFGNQSSVIRSTYEKHSTTNSK